MKPLDEETLSAYCDDALDPDTRAAVERQLQSDQDAQRFVDALRAVNRLAPEAFSAPMHEAPPQALVDMIRNHRPSRRVAAARWRSYALPLAAALVLAIGVGAGLLFSRGAPLAVDALALGDVPDGSVLHRLLETEPSGSRAGVDTAKSDARQLSVVATFADRVGRPCREVELLTGTDQAPAAAAVACRNSGGAWVIEGAVRVAHSAPSGSTQFQPSGAREQDALEGLLTMLGAKNTLTSAEEQAWLQRQWKR